MGRYDNGLSTLFAAMEPSQAIFVHHLRTNPHNVTQVVGSLWDDDHSMCALGLGLEAFGMIKAYKDAMNAPFTERQAFDPYKFIADTLNMPRSHVEQVYELNDTYSLSFGQIADVMEQYFRQGNLSHWATKGPEELWEDSKREEEAKQRKEFAALWNIYKDKHDALLKQAAKALGVGAYKLHADGAFETWSGEDFFDEFLSQL